MKSEEVKAVKNAIKLLESLARQGHYDCEDGYYACPLSQGGSANGFLMSVGECTCGADEHNAKVDEIIAALDMLI